MKFQNLLPEEIKKMVRKQYGEMVSLPSGCGCGSSSCCSSLSETMQGNLVREAGYTEAELSALPKHAVEHAYGCGNPMAFSGVREGQTVVDIGSGAGIDCFLAAEKVGVSGRVIGIDMTPDMIDRARINAREGGFNNVEFRLGEAEAMPVEDSSVDWIISNCVINLSPDKPRVFREIARILKPGGRFLISDIVLGDNLPEFITGNMLAWTGCIGGAIRETDYVKGLADAGLKDVIVVHRIVYDDRMIQIYLEDALASNLPEMKSNILSQISGKIWSAKISGMK